VTRPRTLIGRLALWLFAPDPSDGPLVRLAKLQPDPSVIPIEKSEGRLIYFFAVLAFGFLFTGSLTFIVWSQGEAVIALIFLCLFPVLCLGVPQLVLVAACEQPPLVLEAEGLRVNFADDFIRYDQITKVKSSSYKGPLKLELWLVPGVEFKSNRTAYRLYGHPLFLSLYAISCHDLAEEIERRMKIAAAKASQ
jgi:hypothetical protein